MGTIPVGCQIPGDCPKDSGLQISPSKAAQLKKLLALKKKQINIPVEQLKRRDADRLFTNLLLSGITPDAIKKSNEREWENGLWQLSYEQRQSMAEYQNAARKLALAGYDPANPVHAITAISQRLEAIETANKTERELADEYKTHLQVRRYVKLADEPKFVKGSKWKEMSQENAEDIKTMPKTEHSTELPKICSIRIEKCQSMKKHRNGNHPGRK